MRNVLWTELSERISDKLILEKISLYIFISDFRKKKIKIVVMEAEKLF